MENKPQEPVIVCPIGFSVKPAPVVAKECGHAACYPSSCELLRRQGIDVCNKGSCK